jgi:UDP-N-acetylmuramyl pentapeptide phosphotransferase/UDP-N-acetylglucosamine-1-phosphate transferase
MMLHDLMSPTFTIPVALVCSFLLTGLAAKYANRRGLMDHPGERHSHTMATPRGGGAGLICALVLSSLWFFAGQGGFWISCIVPGTFVLAVLGWWDDHSSLSARLRFFVQLVVSFYLVWCAAENGWLGGIIELAFATFFLIWMTNLYNFMDGSNGMAGLQGVFAGLVLSALFLHAENRDMAVAAALLAACCMGFLPWNLGRARVFMGDVGSLALGFSFGALLIYGVVTKNFSIPVALMVMLVFLLDSTLTLLARVLKGERWYNAHRQHLYQRLIAQGWTHSRVVFLYQTKNLALVLPGIALAVSYPVFGWGVALPLIVVLTVGWCLSIKRLGELA